MDFLTFARSGAELRAGPDSRIIDFAVASSSKVLLLFCGWDLSDSISNSIDAEAYVIEGVPAIVPGGFNTAYGEIITSPSDEESTAIFERCRKRIRCGKANYLASLDNLSMLNPGFNFIDVKAFFNALPEITLDQIVARMNRKREMLTVCAYDPNGHVIDVLVLDEDGVISTLIDGGIMARAAATIRTTSGMATPQEARRLFIDWQPQGCSLGDPVIALHSGTTDDIAQSIFLGTL
jgi:hypothetical protein